MWSYVLYIFFYFIFNVLWFRQFSLLSFMNKKFMVFKIWFVDRKQMTVVFPCGDLDDLSKVERNKSLEGVRNAVGRFLQGLPEGAQTHGFSYGNVGCGFWKCLYPLCHYFLYNWTIIPWHTSWIMYIFKYIHLKVKFRSLVQMLHVHLLKYMKPKII